MSSKTFYDNGKTELSCTVFDNGDWELFKGTKSIAYKVAKLTDGRKVPISKEAMQYIAQEQFRKHRGK